ncbi:MAG: hypothetical protein V3V05_12700 [Pontiella sp.]
MKKKVMLVGFVAMTGALLTLTGCKSMCKMMHGSDDDAKSSMTEKQCPSDCACAKCTAAKAK